MSITTTSPPEAELEARIADTLQRVFPGTTSLRIQQRFKVRVGHTEMEAGSQSYVEGRADILVYQGDEALAVIELKREGLPLTADDEAQGASYALLTRAPIVVITNGSDTNIYQTHDMKLLKEASIDAGELAHRIATAAAAAQSSITGAISKLLGTDLSAAAIAAMNATELHELTGSWTSSQRFVENFLVPRKATEAARIAIRAADTRVVIISGPPLCGKSSVLRELEETADANGWAVLFIEASSCAEGLFRRLANVLAALFSWPATQDDARMWLRRVASRPDYRFVLCIDSLPSGGAVLSAELDEMISGGMGAHLQLVVAVDENDFDHLTLKPNRREPTRLGRNSTRIEVGNYDDNEFASARDCLYQLGGGLVDGGQYAPELRAPWVLRAAVASQMESLPEGSAAVLPPLLGTEMFSVADERFACLGAVRNEIRTLARIYVDELMAKRHHGDRLSSLYVFSVTRENARKNIDRDGCHDLVRAGLVQASTAYSGDSLYVIRVPALFGHEVGVRLATLLQRKVQKNPDEAAKWLVKSCARMPLGDAIGAYAINRSLQQLGPGDYLLLINGLLKLPPVRRPIAPGSKMVAMIPSVGLIDFEVDVNGTTTMRSRDILSPPFTVDLDEEDLVAVANIDGWLILSQLRPFNLAFCNQDGDLLNVAAWLLLEIGSCPVVLRRPGKELEQFHTHAIDHGEMSCLKNGIAEPVTWSITELLVQDIPGVDREAWVREAAATGSLPLINRLGQALSHISNVAGRSEWAEQMLEQVYRPALQGHPQFH
ncbi:type I restriction enzyme HsdR N-terminal domain-containing protein [Denitratisoma oestradiolicum]|uniref:Type I restriction enzyme R protein N-terminal domain-containing protein n=1 Tax=Denitratisoma oestradiolicum TaxID=311182 RepID=A0A6S6XXP6_9PROT|nr:type I restriction enzyme HsdR N-terminal domain-containing protein [Denitratisoma oestradiolicum]TWO82170.1 hypothetical protein CBW56_01640 [Denitratisoma oestradiolicum]CAB1369105.1 conserved protein of unknown function [Denitratisoma oestradiolicum]